MKNIPDAPHDPKIAHRIKGLVDDQKVATKVLSSALTRAIEQIESLSFPLEFPVPGFDHRDVVGTLRDMLPVERIDKWRERATELATTP